MRKNKQILEGGEAIARKEAPKKRKERHYGGSALSRQEKRASRGEVSRVALFERKLLQGSGNGSKNASFEIQEATQSHASESPVPGERKDV
jgi:hypothetical protein